MSTIVYQELQEPRTLSIKLNPSIFFYQTNPTSSYSNMYGSWTAIEALSNGSTQRSEIIEKEPIYVHPLVKRSSSILSAKSLEMCTESLGSENGTFLKESNIFFPSYKNEKPQEKYEKKRINDNNHGGNCNFPPPLTTISGSNSIQVKRYHEHGRLVIKAFSAPEMGSYMRAERSHGRLKLSMVSNLDDDYGSDYDEEDEDGEENEEVEEREVEEDDVNLEEDMNGIKLEFGVKMGNFQRPSRCKEGGRGNKGLINWETFWVAT